MWKKDSKSNGTIHQLSTCDQRFEGLMIVRFNDHRPSGVASGRAGRAEHDQR